MHFLEIVRGPYKKGGYVRGIMSGRDFVHQPLRRKNPEKRPQKAKRNFISMQNLMRSKAEEKFARANKNNTDPVNVRGEITFRSHYYVHSLGNSGQ